MSCKIIISRSDCKGADIITFKDTLIASALYKILKSIEGAKVEDPEAIILAYKANDEVNYHFASETVKDMIICAAEVSSAINNEVSKHEH